MNIERSVARILKTGGLVMAAVFTFAIILGVLELDLAMPITQIGILCAIGVRVIGLFGVMVLLIKNHETNYGLCAIILLILLAVTVIWRMLV